MPSDDDDGGDWRVTGAVLAGVCVFTRRLLVAQGRRMGRVRRDRLFHSHSLLVLATSAHEQTTAHTRQQASGQYAFIINCRS